MSEQVYAVQLITGEVVMGIRSDERQTEEQSNRTNRNDFIVLQYPATLQPVTVEGANGQPEQRMSINPYFPFGEYDQKDGVVFESHAIIQAMPASEGIARAHGDYVNQMRMQSSGLVMANANDLPENQFGVDPSEMTDDGGLRITED